jgi:hypothetical protein
LVVLAAFETRKIDQMAARFAKPIYLAACIAAVLWAFSVFAIDAAQSHPDWTTSTPVAIGGAVVIWICGRAARYVLDGR